MPSENYRYYRLDSGGHLYMAEWFHAENDEDAIAQIGAKHPYAKCEIWQGKRVVAQLSPRPFDPDDPNLQHAVGERLSAFALKMRGGLEA